MVTKGSDLKEFIEKKLKGDKSKLYSMKRAILKKADAVSYISPAPMATPIKVDANKAGMLEESDQKTTGPVVRAVINTSNVFDSHGDVHIPGLWKKSIKENNRFLHLQEHKMDFDFVISQEGTMSAKNILWSSLGYNYEGRTQALVFDSDLTNSENTKMVERYKQGQVFNHSVGMMYVKMFLCVDSKDDYFKEEKTNWDKYIPQVVNDVDAKSAGMMWAVTEAKVIEGSAVVLGSNQMTPTMSVKDNGASGKATPVTESEQTTLEGSDESLISIIKQIKF